MTEKRNVGNREVHYARVGLRIYENDNRKISIRTKRDAKGVFDGFSEVFDEWLPIYSPRFQPFESRSVMTKIVEVDLEDELDH